MGNDASERLDSVWLAKVKRSGMNWERIDNMLATRLSEGAMQNVKIGIKIRPGGALLILEAVVDGRKLVQFRDVESLGAVSGVIQNMLAEPKWKEAKPFVPQNTRSIDKSTQTVV